MLKTPILQTTKSCLAQPNKLSLNRPSLGWIVLGLASLAIDQRGLFICPVKKRRQKMNGVIYEIRNNVNNKRYIGSTIGIKWRKSTHFSLLKRGKHHSLALQRAYNKYGEDAFFFAIIEDGISQDYLIEREQYWLDKLKPEYNVLKMAGSNKGWHHSDKTKAGMSAKRKGRSPSSEWRQKISDARKGYVVPLERRSRISATLMGHAYSVAKPVQQIDLYTNEVIRVWASGKLASEELGINKGNLSEVATGKRPMAGGFKWEFLEND